MILEAAIPRALGLSGAYPETDADGATRRIHGGTVDARGRVAWIEERRDPPTSRGFVDVTVDLRIAWGGALRWCTEIDTDGTTSDWGVLGAAWSGDQVVFACRDGVRGHAIRLDAVGGDEERVPIATPCAFVGGALWSADDRRALLVGRRLPDLAPLPALLLPLTGSGYRVRVTDDVLHVAGMPVQGDRTHDAWQTARLEALARAPAVPVLSAAVRATDLPDAGSCRRRWGRWVAALGVPAAGIDAVVEAFGAPWLDRRHDADPEVGPDLIADFDARRGDLPLAAIVAPLIPILTRSPPQWGAPPGIDHPRALVDTLFRMRIARDLPLVASRGSAEGDGAPR